MELIVGSMALKLRGAGVGSVPVGERKPIRGFSDSSKRHLLWKLQTLDYDKLKAEGWTAWFVTLTYRDVFYREYRNLRRAKEDLDRFFIYLSRLMPLDFFSFWKLEFTRKGIPHFHLFMCVRGNVSHADLIQYVQTAWLLSVSPPGEHLKRMRRASTNVRFTPLDRVRILAVYISKEIGKTYQVDVSDGELPGRFWGIYNRKYYKLYVKEDTVELQIAEFYKLRRIFKNWLYSKGYSRRFRGREGLTLYYVRNVSDLLRALEVVRDELG